MKKTLEKRFMCVCGYVSPAGYKVNDIDCPFCKRDMTKIMVMQFKKYYDAERYPAIGGKKDDNT